MLKEIEHSLRISCAKYCIAWFINNLDDEKSNQFNEAIMKNLFFSIYKNETIFKLYVFDNLKLIDLDMNNKMIIFDELKPMKYK